MGHRLGRVAARLGTVTAIVLLATTAAGTPALAATVTVRIGHSLDPTALRVAPGTTVTWVNADDERHRVRSTSGPVKLDSGNLEPGERFTVKFTQQGRWRYLDDRNRELERYWGTVTVDSSPTGDADGDSGTSAGGGSSSSGGGTAASAHVEVGMADRAFSPRSVTIVASSTVSWVNDDDREHTVSATDGAFDSRRPQSRRVLRGDLPHGRNVSLPERHPPRDARDDRGQAASGAAPPACRDASAHGHAVPGARRSGRGTASMSSMSSTSRSRRPTSRSSQGPP